MIWTLVANWSKCHSLHPSRWINALDIEYWFSQVIGVGDKLTHTLAILTTWSIWKQRNAIIFREERRAVNAVFLEIKDTAMIWAMAGGKFLKPLTVVHANNV